MAGVEKLAPVRQSVFFKEPAGTPDGLRLNVESVNLPALRLERRQKQGVAPASESGAHRAGNFALPEKFRSQTVRPSDDGKPAAPNRPDRRHFKTPQNRRSPKGNTSYRAAAMAIIIAAKIKIRFENGMATQFHRLGARHSGYRRGTQALAKIGFANVSIPFHSQQKNEPSRREVR